MKDSSIDLRSHQDILDDIDTFSESEIFDKVIHEFLKEEKDTGFISKLIEKIIINNPERTILLLEKSCNYTFTHETYAEFIALILDNLSPKYYESFLLNALFDKKKVTNKNEFLLRHESLKPHYEIFIKNLIEHVIQINTNASLSLLPTLLTHAANELDIVKLESFLTLVAKVLCDTLPPKRFKKLWENINTIFAKDGKSLRHHFLPEAIGNLLDLLDEKTIKSLISDYSTEDLNKICAKLCFVNLTKAKVVFPELDEKIAVLGKEISNFSRLIFFNSILDCKEAQIKPEKFFSTFSVFYNNSIYLQRENSNSNPLFYENRGEKIPIGYNIFLPDSEFFSVPPKAIIVEVYGGFQSSEKETKAYRPYRTDPNIFYLSQNIGYITLNLCDLLLLKTSQAAMPENIHSLIHASINYFFSIIKKDPSSLNSELKKYKINESPLFLYGASFGGRTAVRHAQLYPNSFSGYISHDGALDYLRHLDHLRVIQPEKIKRISKPLLILQNLDDSRVRFNQPLSFFKKFVEHNSIDKVRLCFTKVGNPTNTTAKNEDITLRGHFLPISRESFYRYVETISNFVTQGPSSIPEVSVWSHFKAENLLNAYIPTGDIATQLQAEAYRIYKNLAPRVATYSNDIGYVIRQMENPNSQYNQDDIDKLWKDKYYSELLATLHVNKLLSNKDINLNEIASLISNEQISNALKHLSPVYFLYLEERYNMKFSDDLDTGIAYFSNNQLAINLFKIMLSECKENEEKRILLTALYKSNPELIVIPENEKKQYAQFLENAKSGLIHTIKTEHQHVRQIWKKAANKSLENEKKQIDKIIAILESDNPEQQLIKLGHKELINSIVLLDTIKNKSNLKKLLKIISNSCSSSKCMDIVFNLFDINILLCKKFSDVVFKYYIETVNPLLNKDNLDKDELEMICKIEDIRREVVEFFITSVIHNLNENQAKNLISHLKNSDRFSRTILKMMEKEYETQKNLRDHESNSKKSIILPSYQKSKKSSSSSSSIDKPKKPKLE